MTTIEQLVEALKRIVETPPAQQDGGGFIVEHFDGDGNYAGSQNIDPMWVIQEMQAIACAAIAAGEAELRREPVAFLFQHSETGRTRVVMKDDVMDASATWFKVGPYILEKSNDTTPTS